ncbi:DUF2058 family protein [Thermodesulfobacteriota bacterium]
MKSLKDQLLAKKIVDRKQVRRAEHEERLRRKSIGREGLEAERRRAREAAEATQRDTRKRDKARESKRQAELRAQEEESRQAVRVEDLAASGAIREGVEGERRFFFKARSGRVPSLNVSETMEARLVSGRAAIVELSEGATVRWVIVGRSTADKILAIDPEAVRFLNLEAAE